MDLDPHDPAELFLIEHFINNQCYEPELAWVMFRTLTVGDTAIDVGANVGFFTLLMSALVGSMGKVFSCEPGSNTLPRLKNNLAINSVANVEVVERPLWCREEEVTFYINSDSSGGNALFDPANWPTNTKSQQNPQPNKMLATTIDALPAGIPKLIKIDTEGAEQRILEGAKRLLRASRPPFVIAEINPHGLQQAGCSETSLRGLMDQFDYEAFVIHNDGSIPALLPDNTRINADGDVRISNILFSTMDDVSAAWPVVFS